MGVVYKGQSHHKYIFCKLNQTLGGVVRMRLKQMITPICIVLMLVIQSVNYFLNEEVSWFLLSTACFLSPTAIKELKFKFINSKIDNAFLIIGLILFSIGIYINFIIQ